MKSEIIIIVLFVLIFLTSPAFAQNGSSAGSAPASSGTSQDGPASAVSAPRAATSSSATPRPIKPTPPAAGGSATPRPIGATSTPTPISTTINEPTTESSPASNLSTFGITALAAAILAAGGYGAYKLKTKKHSQQDARDESRCFNLKKMMEDKLNELTDLRGQLESKSKEKIKEKTKEAIAGTVAEEIVERIERAKGEYEKFKRLYEECMVEFAAKKRIFIVHGWDGYPEEGWFPWLKKELEARGFKVFVPQLPNAENPRIEKWVPALASAVGTVDKNTYFVGHSMGCQAIARYLESLPVGVKVGGIVFVGGFFKRLTGLEDDPDVQETNRLWFEAPIDFKTVKSHFSKSVAIFSDDDPFVPLDNQDAFRYNLGSEIIIEHSKGHFTGGRDKIFSLSIVLEKLLKIL